MTEAEAPNSNHLTVELSSTFDQIQKTTIRLAIPGVYAAAVILFGLVGYLPNFFWAFLTASGLLFLSILLWIFSSKSFAFSSVLLVTGSLATVIAVTFWGGFPVCLFLLILPVGLAQLSLGMRAGVSMATLCSFFLVFQIGPLKNFDPALSFTIVVGIWGTVGMIWLTLRPLLTAVESAWIGYEQSRSYLEQARDYQAKLQQTLEDLTDANTQLTRLNQLANGLRKMAEEERHIKEQFVANVSHELRTPLNMIIGFCEMILKAPHTYGRSIPANLLADLEVVLRNSQHLSSLIDDVLDLSQIEAGQMVLTMESTNLAEIVQSATIAVRPLYESKKLTVEVEIQEDMPLISCDRTRIREVLLNLLSNAGRFTDVGGVKIRVVRDGNHVVVSVADTGKGISDADKSKLFRPFHQLDGTIRRRYGGTGLGLSISKSFVELHDGKMWVESQEGVGTTFYFRLPIEAPAPYQSGFARWINPFQSYQEKDHRPQLPQITVRPRYVVVDNHNVMKRVLDRYLTESEVVQFPDLDSAIVELAHTPARALLINDLQPQAVLDQLNGPSSLPNNTPAIICSIPGYASETSSMPVTGYLVKPVSRDQLLNTLKGLNRPVKTILIVDDEPDVLQLFRRMLTSARQGYRVLRASNGLEAIDILKNQPVDVILLDLIMPEMNGFQFLAAMNSNSDTKDIPIILLSVHDPKGEAIVSYSLTATRAGGLSFRQLLASIDALSAILSPIGQPAGLAPSGKSPG